MVGTRDGRMNSPISYSPWERHYPGREMEEEKLTAWKRLKKKTEMAPLSPCIPYLHCSELPSRNVFYIPTFWTFPDKRMLFLSMLLSLTIADRHLTCNKVFIARNKEIGWALPCIIHVEKTMTLRSDQGDEGLTRTLSNACNAEFLYFLVFSCVV